MNKKVILFDIDYTLLDTTKLKKLVAEKLVEHFPPTDMRLVDEIYAEVRQEGAFDPKLFAQLFKDKHGIATLEEEIERLWFDKHTLQQALYSEVLSTLQQLQKRKNYVLGIFSSGKTEFQLQKISSLSDFFVDKHIHVAEFKEETLPEVMREYESEQVMLVDDLITVLQKAKSYKKDLSAIWMKRGKFALSAEIPVGFEPDATITNLTEVVDILDNETI